jgi:hypothetical protein
VYNSLNKTQLNCWYKKLIKNQIAQRYMNFSKSNVNVGKIGKCKKIAMGENLEISSSIKRK